MIPVEQAVLKEILLDGVNVTNSETQAMKWAQQIIALLRQNGLTIQPTE